MQLIKIENSTIGQDVKETVNARELHSFLESKSQFADWIKTQIERARLVENQDFVTIQKKVNRQTLIDYHLTIEAGKSIGMMSATDKGFEIRDYFLECERHAKNPLLALNDPATLKQLLLANLSTIEEQKTQIEQRDKFISVIQPKAAIADRLVTADGLYNLTTAAKLMNCQPRQFNKDLNARGWIYRMGGKGAWVGYTGPTKSGLVDHKLHPFEHTDGTPDTSAQVFITVKGMHKLAGIYNVEFSEAAQC